MAELDPLKPSGPAAAGWREVADVLAWQVLHHPGFEDVVADLQQRLAAEGHSPQSLAVTAGPGHAIRTALELITSLDARFPQVQGEIQDLRSATATLQRAAQEDDVVLKADPPKSVLIGPRFDGSRILRIVLSTTGRVRPEFLSHHGWRNFGYRTDLAFIVRAPSVPRAIATVISQSLGELDALPEPDVRATLVSLDATVAQRFQDARESPEYLRIGSYSSRFVYPTGDYDDHNSAGAPAALDHAIANELLRITPGLWPSIRLEVTADSAEERGFRFRIIGPREQDQAEPSLRLRVLAAQWYQLFEERQSTPWSSIYMTVSRPEPADWRVETRFEYEPKG